MSGTGKKIGYVRVSTLDQKTERQLDGLKLDRIFEDKVSGKNMTDRPQLQEMLRYVRDDDQIFVHSMDRLARNLEDLLKLVRQINEAKASITFVKENLTFSPREEESAMSKLILSVMGAVAEFERRLILERQREGIALAKTRGVYKGRVKKVTPQLLESARHLLRTGKGPQEVAKELGVSRSSLYRWFAEAGEPLTKQYFIKTENE